MENNFVEEITMAMNSIDNGDCYHYLQLLLILYFDLKLLNEFKDVFSKEALEREVNKLKEEINDRKTR